MFSDDIAGPAAAILIARGLATLGGPVRVVAVLPSSLTGPQREGLALAGAEAVDEADWPTLLAAGMGGDGDVVIALPLARLSERPLRGALDAVLTIGRDHPASARALRAARFDVGRSAEGGQGTGERHAPPWFMPCSHQVDLWTKATLAASPASARLPFATRALPIMLPRFDLDAVTLLAADEPPISALRMAVLTASLAMAITADPHAQHLDAAAMTRLMMARDAESERLVSDRLLELSTVFEDLELPPEHPAEPRRTVLPSARRRLEPTRRDGAIRTEGVLRASRVHQLAGLC